MSVSVCVCVCTFGGSVEAVCTYKSRYLQSPEEGVVTHGVSVTAGCELLVKDGGSLARAASTLNC